MITSRAFTILFLCGSIGAGTQLAHAQGKRKPVKAAAVQPASQYRSLSAREIEVLIQDVGAANPQLLERLAKDKDLRKSQLENLKRLLAFASQAEKDGISLQPTNKRELESIRGEVIAGNYDREINKGMPGKAPFAGVTDARVAAFWKVPGREAAFESYLNAKLDLIKASNPAANRPVTKEEREQVRDVFAKTQIVLADYDLAKKQRKVGKDFVDRVELNVKLQRAQFLSKAYLNANASKFDATDAEVAAFIASHPELSPATKRATAQTILDRAKAGENFAELANQFSEDPGNRGSDNGLNGGAYKDVPLGMMVKPFESAALALDPGQIAPQLVESDFGFHIIKLDRKSDKDGKYSYDVRHILISTTVPDPANPNARPLPLKDYAARAVGDEKEDKLVAQLVAANKITVPDDLVIPPTAVKTAPAKSQVRTSK